MSRVDLGIDTGGTFTDAVLMRDGSVIASAKALTTRDDLARGVTEAVRRVLADADQDPRGIGFAALSTTLATNALIEGQGGRAALVAIGFDSGAMERGGLKDALQGDPCLLLAGGHGHAGEEAAPLDLAALHEWALRQDVEAFAIAAQFATRNPAHELAAGALIREVADRPVTLSHMLSARLGGPKRALTALLNARLVSLTHRLIGRAEAGLRDLGITAPLMVVRGDGALMSAAQASERPIETILSGPAASVVGASWLTGGRDGFVADIGGTTTDIALVRGGRPRLDPDGARVGAHATMVEAVAMRTHGLGGDSAVRLVEDGLDGRVSLGPDRVVPVSLAARDAPDAVHRALDDQLARKTPGQWDGWFVRASGAGSQAGLDARQVALLQRIGTETCRMDRTLEQRRDQAALRVLVARGLVQLCAVTPTDAVQVLGGDRIWDTEAAEKALSLLARRRTGAGMVLAPDAVALAGRIVEEMTARTTAAVLDCAFAEDAGWDGAAPAELAGHLLTRRGLGRHDGLVRVSVSLGLPLIGLGASARCYYPAVGERLGTEAVLPELGGVANAIGAVVGQIAVRRAGQVTQPSEGRFRAHLGTGPRDFTTEQEALAALEALLRDEAMTAAKEAGAGEAAVTVSRDIRRAEVEGREMLIEADITVEASGRPTIA